MKNKLVVIKVNIVAMSKFDTTCFGESWLDDTVFVAELYLDDCCFYRSDRDFLNSGKSRAERVITYFRKEIKFNILSNNQFFDKNLIVKFTDGDDFFYLA